MIEPTGGRTVVVRGDPLVQICVGHGQRLGCIFSLFVKSLMRHEVHLDAKMILKAVEFPICLTVSCVKRSQGILY